MERLLLISLLISLTTCQILRKDHLVFEPSRAIKYRFEVPNAYQESRIVGDNEYAQDYWYEDSAVFYLTTFSNTYNYDEIRAQGTYYQRFESIILKPSGDTLTLCGYDDAGLAWKDKLLIDGVTIGYSRVPAERLEAFEYALSSVRKIARSPTRPHSHESPILMSRQIALAEIKEDIASNELGLKDIFVSGEPLDFTSEIFFFPDSIVRYCEVGPSNHAKTYEGPREAFARTYNGLLFFSKNEGSLFIAELFPIKKKRKFLLKDKPAFGVSYLYLFCEQDGIVSLLSKIMLQYN